MMERESSVDPCSAALLGLDLVLVLEVFLAARTRSSKARDSRAVQVGRGRKETNEEGSSRAAAFLLSLCMFTYSEAFPLLRRFRHLSAALSYLLYHFHPHS